MARNETTRLNMDHRDMSQGASLVRVVTVFLTLVLPIVLLTGCDKAYYGAMKKLGIEKRHILVDRVEEARDGQEEAKGEFRTTLERFKELTGFDGEELEETYERLSDSYDDCEESAQMVRDRVKAVDDVAKDLFEEWEEEADSIEKREFRDESKRLLRDTEGRYRELAQAMEKAVSRMEPPLAAFHDQVLFLKHTLNAKMVASLKGQVAQVEGDVEALIREMETSIAEANRFIESMPLD